MRNVFEILLLFHFGIMSSILRSRRAIKLNMRDWIVHLNYEFESGKHVENKLHLFRYISIKIS